MIPSALMAWLHYVSIFSAIGLLVAEFMLYRPELPEKLAKNMAKLDGAYGIAALAIVATGFLRAGFFEKGWSYYEFHPIFWTKVGIYVLWAALSLPPTIHFFRIRKYPVERGLVRIDPAEFKRIRSFMIAQFCVAPIPPLLAALLARGFATPSL